MNPTKYEVCAPPLNIDLLLLHSERGCSGTASFIKEGEIEHNLQDVVSAQSPFFLPI